MIWTPDREWEGQDAFLIGGGPSLSEFDFFLLKGLNTIGCNDAFRLGSEIVKICIFGDGGWWHRNKWSLDKYQGRVVTNSPTLMMFEVPGLLKMTRQKEGLGTSSALAWNFSTGAMAINLAVSLGAARIFLLGYDVSNKNSKSHWHAHNPNPIKDASFARFLNGFKKVRECLPKNAQVLNVTDGGSALRVFPTMTFEAFYDVLASRLAHHAAA